MVLRIRRWSGLVVVTALTAMLAWVTTTAVEPPRPAAAASGTLTGLVFHDYDSDGARDTGGNGLVAEAGLAGVTVRAFDVTGTMVASTTSAGDGTYSLLITSAQTEDVRVEFETPDGFESSFSGPDAGPSVQFATVAASSVNYAVHHPEEFCQANPTVYTACFYPGTRDWIGDLGSLRRTEWLEVTSDDGINNDVVPDGTDVLTKSGTGAVWGVATHRQTGLVYTSAVIRRHADLGPKGIGGLYITTTTGALVASFDLQAEFPSVVSLSAGPDYSAASRGINRSNYSTDLIGYAAVGVAGIGDIDITPDGRYLYLTNLHKRSVIRIELGGTAAAPTLSNATEFPLPGTLCPTSTERPWALEYQLDGTIAVGVACSDLREYDGPVDATEISELPDDAVIAQLDPVTGNWSELTTVSFDYPRQTDFCSGSDDTATGTTTGCLASRWHPWTNDWADISEATKGQQTNQLMRVWPQPMIMDIETLDDGSFAVGISDRLSMQLGANWEPVQGSTTAVYTWVHGDALLLCRDGSGWTQENGGDCDGDTAYQSSRSFEFFEDRVQHNESVLGGLVINPNRADNTMAMALMDPADINSSGYVTVDLADGDIIDRSSGPNVGGITHVGNRVQAAPDDSNQNNTATFQKAASLGDMEVLCDMAPVQIGDRLWYDNDGDGVQDPGEQPIVGVTVRLYDATGTTLLGTAVTDADGRYTFDSVSGEAAAGNGDASGGGLVAGAGNIIRLDNPDDYAPGGPLDGYQLTSRGAGSKTGIDSNASMSGQFAQMTVDPVEPGVNDHTYDVGFRRPPPPPPPPPSGGGAPVTTPTTTTEPETTAPVEPATGTVAVGDFVWIDSDRDGRQDPGEAPLAGATLTITNMDGSPVLDADGNPVGPIVTDSSGRYLFDNLPPGQYQVTITYPAGYVATTPGIGDPALDSATVVAVSRVLAAGEQDVTLDFGVVPLPGRLPETGRDGGTASGLAAMFVGVGMLIVLAAARRRIRTL